MKGILINQSYVPKLSMMKMNKEKRITQKEKGICKLEIIIIQSGGLSIKKFAINEYPKEI